MRDCNGRLAYLIVLQRRRLAPAKTIDGHGRDRRSTGGSAGLRDRILAGRRGLSSAVRKYHKSLLPNGQRQNPEKSLSKQE